MKSFILGIISASLLELSSDWLKTMLFDWVAVISAFSLDSLVFTFFGVLGFLLYVLAADACLGLRDWLGSVLSLIFAITSTCFCIYYYKQGEHAFKQKIKEYKDNNPDDPCIAYL